jgi:cyclophilin family peptidyl-prolyl cis-trans isomerase
MLAASVLKQVMNEYPGQVRLVYRNFSVGHTLSDIAIQAAEAAALQGKYWDMYEVLFNETTWEAWNSKSVADFKTWVTEQAKALGMDEARFASDLTSSAVDKKLNDDNLAAQAAGMDSTPSLFVLFDNELYFTPEEPVWPNLKGYFMLWQLQSRLYTSCPPMTIDGSKTYTATLSTSKGDIVIELYPGQAPLTVNSFVFLAREGWYANVPFHRVIEGFVAQTGDPTGSGMGGPGYQFGDEIVSTLNFDVAGMVGMANAGPGTNGSQFFITLTATSALNNRYTVFGKVTQGLDVLTQLTRVDPSKLNQPAPDVILSVTISEK